jgi:hypothetical protein
MSESPTKAGFPHPGWAVVSRLLLLVGRSASPPRPTDDLLSAWHEAAGTTLPFPEWCDPIARNLATTLSECRESQESRLVDASVVAFAQARAGSDHTAEAVAADLVALLQLVEADGAASSLDPVGLVARALAAWASERVAGVSTASCLDPVTGLVNGGFLRARLRELHAQCDALAISPPMTFGSLIVQLDLGATAVPERMSVRVAVGGALGRLFTTGETVATLSASRVVVVMPAYALGRAEDDVQVALTKRPELVDVPVALGQQPFGITADGTWHLLAGTRVGA